MRAAWSRLASTELSARKSIAILVLILLTVSLQSALAAVSKPFWYDEILTVILCRLPSVSAIWMALHHAADTHPPGFYLIARLTYWLISDDHLGYRLPSILGLLLTVGCVYSILSRRVARLTALVGATFLLCTDLTSYSYEARPYALMVGCISVAILAWQRIDDSWLYCAALVASLAAAVSLHYYAIFVWSAFAVAELTVWMIRRRFRFTVWASLLVGACPLLCFLGLLREMVKDYGQNFWAQPQFKQTYLTYSNLLNVEGHWGVIVAIGFTAVIIWFNVIKTPGVGISGDQKIEAKSVPIEEWVLAITLMWLPAIAVCAAKISHGGLTERHMLPAVVGCALTLGYAIEKVPVAGRLLLLILFLMNYEAFSVPVLRETVTGSLFAQRESAEHEMTSLAGQLREPNLPIVIGGELDYLPIAYYTPPELGKRIYAVVDPQSAITYLNTASGDLNLLVIQHYYPLQVKGFDSFISNHREFYLVSGADLDWLPARLVHDGDNLKLVAAGKDGEDPVYEVSMGPESASQ
jgi:Dolichyl-phosphate-mannose-protein mannosyltransferase